MIAVIADDLTGAAELAGIGLAYGLNVELATTVNQDSAADLLVIATDARSVSEAEAVHFMVVASQALRAMVPQLLYKKVDSVLRGHVIAETLAQLEVFNLEKALIIPANPTLGRTLVDGHYYIHGELIHQTHFADDPEFPIRESNVLNRFKPTTDTVSVQSCYGDTIDSQLIIGEVGTQADLHGWLRRLTPQTLACGGAGFFTAILDTLFSPTSARPLPPALGDRRLYVCGSAFGTSVDLVRQAADSGLPVSYMPAELLYASDLESSILRNWAAQITGYVRQHRQAILAIDPGTAVGSSGVVAHLRTVMAKVVRQVLDRTPIDELIIEGGSTASAVLREMGVWRLVPVQELAPGVVRSSTPEKDQLHITVKPGSYRWPPALRFV